MDNHDHRKSRHGKRSTVGLMLQGCMVDNLVVGGPAYASGVIGKGDMIVKVNEQMISDEKMLHDLLGNNQPGSEVSITIRKHKTNLLQDVTLTSVATKTMASRHRMFELFTQLKDRSTRFDDFEWTSHTVDDCIEIWTDLLLGNDMCEYKNAAKIERMNAICANIGANLAEFNCFIDQRFSGCESHKRIVRMQRDDLFTDFNSVFGNLEYLAKEVDRTTKYVKLLVSKLHSECARNKVVSVNDLTSGLKRISLQSEAHVNQLSGCDMPSQFKQEWFLANCEHQARDVEIFHEHGDNSVYDYFDSGKEKEQSASELPALKTTSITELVADLIACFQDIVSQLHSQLRLIQDENAGHKVSIEVLKAIIRTKNKGSSVAYAGNHDPADKKPGSNHNFESVYYQDGSLGAKMQSTSTRLTKTIAHLFCHPRQKFPNLFELLEDLTREGIFDEHSEICGDFRQSWSMDEGTEDGLPIMKPIIPQKSNHALITNTENCCANYETDYSGARNFDPPTSDAAFTEAVPTFRSSEMLQDRVFLNSGPGVLVGSMQEDCGLPLSRNSPDLNKEVGGVGMRIQICYDSGTVEVASLVPQGPAMLNGNIMVGDLILAVDRQSLESLSKASIMKMILGPPGTVLELDMMRPAGGAYKVIFFRRSLLSMQQAL